MKCPKCGYNSFEYLDTCKKCNNDLSSFKTSHGIRAIVLPFRQRERSAPREEPQFSPQPAVEHESDDGMFSWHGSAADTTGSLERDLPEPEPFSFDLDLPALEAQSAPAGDEGQTMSFDDLCGTEGGTQAIDSGEKAESVEKDPAQEMETAFGDFSFDELYAEKDTAASPPESEYGSIESIEGFLRTGPDETGGEFEADISAEAGDMRTLESAPAVDTALEDRDPFAFDEPFEDGVKATEVDQEEDATDTMGLSPEEYEALFGEPPKKKAR